jgi:hypothetical protein
MDKKALKFEERELKYVSSGTIEEFLKNIREAFEENVPEEFRSVARLVIEGNSYDSWSAEGYIRVSWTRDETEAEEKIRVAQEKLHLEYRRKQYEQLKKEFG